MSRRTVLRRSSKFRSSGSGDGGAGAVRKLVAAIGLFVLMLAAVITVGETWGTRKPTPGRSVPETVCTGGRGGTGLDCITR